MIPTDKARELLQAHGDLREQPASDWNGEIPLPRPLIDFYREVGPDNITIPTDGNDYFLPRLADLWSFQAGYRWNGITKERIPDWREEWIVVADQGGDPFIYSLETGTILLAAHGSDKWEPVEIFSSLNDLACLGAIGNVVRDAGQDFTDDDCMIQEQYADKLITDLTLLLGSKSGAKSALWNLGYLPNQP